MFKLSNKNLLVSSISFTPKKPRPKPSSIRKTSLLPIRRSNSSKPKRNMRKLSKKRRKKIERRKRKTPRNSRRENSLREIWRPRKEENKPLPKLMLKNFNWETKLISSNFKPFKDQKLILSPTVKEMDSTVTSFSPTLLKRELLRKTHQLTWLVQELLVLVWTFQKKN